MIYVGMDISSKSFMIYAMNERKTVMFKGEIDPTRAGLRELVSKLGDGNKYFAFEAGNQMKWISDTLKKIKGSIVHVVHPNEVKWITQSKKKTDKVDAKKLALLALADHLPRPVHVVEGQARELRELCAARETIQVKKISFINAMRGLAKQEGFKLSSKFYKSSNWEEQLALMNNVSANLRLIIGTYMKAMLDLHEAETQLTEELKKVEDKRIDLLKTIPAIGDISSRVIVGAFDNAKRFDNKKCAAKYSGLTPTIYQSGDTTQLGRINRDGRKEVRRMLLQCAHTVTRMKSYEVRPLKRFFERIERKRGKKIAVVALARKLLVIAYSVLRSEKAYDPRILEPAAV